jgi:hypothetical protein
LSTKGPFTAITVIGEHTDRRFVGSRGPASRRAAPSSIFSLQLDLREMLRVSSTSMLK